MKKILLMLVGGIMALTVYSQDKKGYVIEGEIANCKDGVSVWLVNDDMWPEKPVGDTVLIKDGKFRLTGQVDAPMSLKLIINPDPANEENEEIYATRFYLENAVIGYTGDLNTLEMYYYNPESAATRVPATVTGSRETDLFFRYQKELKPLRAKKEVLIDRQFDLLETEGGQQSAEAEMAELSVQLEAVDKAIRDLQLTYIRENPSTRVAVDLAQDAIGFMFVQMTAGQIAALENLLARNWPDGSEVIAEFKKYAAQKTKTAIGSPFPSAFGLLTQEEKTVKLSEFIPKGKYVLVEFWSSTCAPCRGDIPHVKEIYSQYKDKGLEIVYISTDVKLKHWTQALKAEKMPWPQLWSRSLEEDPLQNPAITEFNALALPTSYLLDREGKILVADVRGAKLNHWLEKLLGPAGK